MPLPLGTRLGRYEVRSQIGAGGMGEVYLARDTTELERMVAVKVLPAELAQDPERMRRFVQEAKTASSLNHPNIVTIHEIGEVNSSRFIVTELVEGETLRQKITRSRLTLREALDLAIQIASALVAAHRAGVVHRDIKPENVMVREDGIVKVLDFGLAKPTGRPTNQPSADSEAATRALVNTSPGMIMGTVAYMSPEQARGLPVDERTDIWSLGVVLYEMVSGRLPFAGETTSDVLAHVLTKEPPTLALTSERANERLDEVIQKALAKDREERYQHVKDLLIDLKRLKQKLDVEAEIERTQAPEEGAAMAAAMSGAGRAAVETVDLSAARTADLGGAHPTSSAEYVVSEIKQHRRGALVILATLVVLVAAASYFYLARTGGAAIDSIAVLPFVNADPNAEWLSDGITESIINSLSQAPNLRVMARSTIFRYKGREGDPLKVGRELGVRALLTGRVTQRGDSLSIQAELVDASTGAQLWGEQYNRKVSDVLSVQQDISREIADKLRLRLTGEQRGRLTRRYTEDAEAYQLYLKGRFFWNKRTGEALKESIKYFNQAIEKDPSYALAYAGLADAHTLSFFWGNVPPTECYPKARAAARRALEIDDTLAEAHTALAYPAFIFGWDFAGAEREFRRAIELNPNYATTHHWYGECLNALGRHEEAIAEMKRAQELDPLSLIVNSNIGLIYVRARRYDQAIEELQKALAMDQSFAPTFYFLMWAYQYKGMFEEAATAYGNYAVLSGDVSQEEAERRATALKEAYRKSGAKGYWQKQLDLWTEDRRQHYVDTYSAARFSARLGDKDQAMAWLQKGYDERVEGMVFLKVEPDFDDLQADPRFRDLVRRVGLPQ